MRAPRSRVARIQTAERPGAPTRTSEDRIFTTHSAVIVLDGASQPEPSEHDGRWLADTLGKTLIDELTSSPGTDLADLLAKSIVFVARQYSLTPRQSPSTTVSIARWYNGTLEALVLGDSPIVTLGRNGDLLQLRDDRLSQVASVEREAFRKAGSVAFGVDRPQEWQNLVDAQRRQRNVPGGYWIAEAVPDAAMHARRAQWNLHDIAALMLMTDGVSNGIDRYGVPATWRDAFAVAIRDPCELVDCIHEAEEADMEGVRWPRSKIHDDKALVLVEFANAMA